MKIEIDSFRGEAPRLTPRALPPNAAQVATNARLLSGDLEPWRQFAVTKALATAAPVQTIYLLNGRWLSWQAQVDVARGPVAGDTEFRTYLTAPGFYAEPRFTTFALATTGSEPYPVATRPLGVPAPDSAPVATPGVSTAPSIDVDDAGDQLATSWTASGTVSAGSVISEAVQDASKGNTAPSYRLTSRNNTSGNGAYIYRDFGVADSSVVEFSCDFNVDANGGATIKAGWRIATTAAGGGAYVYIGYPYGVGTGYLVVATAADWNSDGSLLAAEPITLTGDGSTWYRMRIVLTRQENGSTKVDAEVYSGSTLLFDASATAAMTIGGYCGLQQISGQGTDPSLITHYDNLSVQGAGSATTAASTATAYLYTFVNDVGQESAPSPVSSTVLRPDGVAVTVTTDGGPSSAISDAYGITLKRLYRAATGASGSIFQFVAEIDIDDTEYVDELSDAQLGEALPSEGWELPPDDLEGIIALPNGIMAGFVGNQLCLSAQNRPHAWPVAFRQTTDSEIVGIANVDTTVVIGTRTFVYTASGTSPDSYTMSKPGVPQACVSKRSMATLYGGVVFASPDGLMLVAGPTQVRNLTAGIFTREQWQALHPESIIGGVHDDVYFFFFDPTYTPDGAPAGYAIDAKEDGFGVIRLSFHATALHTDPLTDSLHLVLDSVDEPVAPYLLDASTAPNPGGSTIYEFDADDSNALVYQWRGKLNLLPHPACFLVCQVDAEDYDNLVLRLYGDGDVLIEQPVLSVQEFTLPMLDAYREFEIEILGTSRVRRIQVAEDVAELT